MLAPVSWDQMQVLVEVALALPLALEAFFPVVSFLYCVNLILRWIFLNILHEFIVKYHIRIGQLHQTGFIFNLSQILKVASLGGLKKAREQPLLFLSVNIELFEYAIVLELFFNSGELVIQVILELL